MALTATTHRKEQLIITDEQGRSFVFDCGCGVDPPVAYVPPLDQWQDCVPAWLWTCRGEVIESMKTVNHGVLDGRYPPLGLPANPPLKPTEAARSSTPRS